MDQTAGTSTHLKNNGLMESQLSPTEVQTHSYIFKAYPGDVPLILKSTEHLYMVFLYQDCMS